MYSQFLDHIRKRRYSYQADANIPIVFFIPDSAVVEEIYAAQKDRDEAIMSRLRLANEERDESMTRLRRMENKDDFDSGTDVDDEFGTSEMV